MESRRNGPQLSSRHDDDDDVHSIACHEPCRLPACLHAFCTLMLTEVGFLITNWLVKLSTN